MSWPNVLTAKISLVVLCVGALGAGECRGGDDSKLHALVIGNGAYPLTRSSKRSSAFDMKVSP